MRDPREGLTADAMIRTGVRRDRVPAVFVPVIEAAIEAMSELAHELHLYGSVATGQAEAGRSDVDLLAIGVPAEQASPLGQELSRRFAAVCRAVEIGPAEAGDFRQDSRQDSQDDDDESYGNRVFLRHYCVSLSGPDELRSASPFPGDARAARGFNGDLGRCLDRWRQDADEPTLGRRIARKTLVAVAGLVSVHDRTWTTDRDAAARRWAEIDPRLRAQLDLLGCWSLGDRTASASELAEALAPDGIVATIVAQFADKIGLWTG